MSTSLKLKKAMAQGKVVAENKTSGEVRVFLLDANGKQFFLDVPPKAKVELAPKHCPVQNIDKSRNLDTLLKGGHLRLVTSR